MSTIHGQPEHNAGAVRTSAETAPYSQEPRQKHQQTENAAEDPRSRHPIRRTEDRAKDPKNRPRRADPRRNADRMQKPQPEP